MKIRSKAKEDPAEVTRFQILDPFRNMKNRVTLKRSHGPIGRLVGHNFGSMERPARTQGRVTRHGEG